MWHIGSSHSAGAGVDRKGRQHSTTSQDKIHVEKRYTRIAFKERKACGQQVVSLSQLYAIYLILILRISYHTIHQYIPGLGNRILPIYCSRSLARQYIILQYTALIYCNIV